MAFLFHHVFQQLQEEGVEQIPMCLDIGRNIDTPTPGDSFLIRRGQSFLRRYTGLIFDFSGVHHFKSRFRPRYENRYVCTSPNATVGSLIAYLLVSGSCRLNPWNLACSVVNRIRKRSTRKSLWKDGSKSSTG
jgi:phosphatidylglycerol lysyltransferase